MKKEVQFKELLVLGFALFAMFFGAGNLIFPPYLGMISGTQWWLGFLGFMITDAGLALLGVIALSKFDGELGMVTEKINKQFGIFVSLAIVLCIGPLFATPRTAAATFEIGIQPIFGDMINRNLFSIIFFAVVCLLTVKDTKVVEIVGKFLTPILLICMIVLIVAGVVRPFSEIGGGPIIESTIKRGIQDGYQTMDALASCMFALIIVKDIKNMGLSSKKKEVMTTVYSGVIAAVCLGVIYGGLTYLGAQLSGNAQYGIDSDQTAILVDITYRVLGSYGQYIIAIIAGFACLTTAIGLVSSTANYFNELFKGKISYVVLVIVTSIVCAFISMLGVGQILKIAAPVLEIIYPCVVTIILVALFDNYIHDNIIYKIPTYVSFICGIILVLHGMKIITALDGIIMKLPFYEIGLAWVLPTFISLVVAIIISGINKKA